MQKALFFLTVLYSKHSQTGILVYGWLMLILDSKKSNAPIVWTWTQYSRLKRLKLPVNPWTELISITFPHVHSISPRLGLPALLLSPERRAAAQHFEDGQRALQGRRAPAPQRHDQHAALLRQRCEDGCPAAEQRAAVWEPAGGIWTHRHEGLRIQWGRKQVLVMLLFVVSQLDFEKFRIFPNWCINVILKNKHTVLLAPSTWSLLQ